MREPVHFSAYVRVKNFREAPHDSLEFNQQAAVEPNTPFKEFRKDNLNSNKYKESIDSSIEGERSSDRINLETLPKMILATPAFISDHYLLVQHTEAVYLLRKYLIEAA